MAAVAMAARNSHSPLKEFYNNLVNRGKKKMVALTALMRKILVIANAKLKNLADAKLLTT
jgi:transposase